MLNRRSVLAGGRSPRGRAAAPPRACRSAGRGKGKPKEPAPPGTPGQHAGRPGRYGGQLGASSWISTRGATLLDKDADVAMPPSSMTKLMTAYIVYAALKSGKLKLTDELPVSEKAWRMGGSKMFVQVGTSVKVEDLIRGMIVQSGNDACIVLAEGIAGSEEQFVELMNAEGQGARPDAARPSATRTGWPDPEHRMSLPRHRDAGPPHHPGLSRNIYHYDSEKTFKYNNIEQENRNPLVQKGTADGLKTGHTEEGGYGLCASSERNGRRVIVVLNGMTSMHQRAEEGERLMEWAFREFEDVTLFTAGDVVERAPVWLGSAPSVPLVGGRDLVVTMPRNWRKNAKISVAYDAPIRAPGRQGRCSSASCPSVARACRRWRCRCSPAPMCRSSGCRGARWRCCRTT